MDKKLFSALLLAAAVMSSCSQNEVNEILPESDNVDVVSINTAVGATRAVDTDGAALQSGVTLYYYQTSALSNIAFTYDGGWESSDVLWSNITLPTYFYSMHNGTAAQTLTNNNATKADGPSFDVVTAPASQVDLVYYASYLTEMPTGGTVNVMHNHALSKLAFKANNGLKALQIASVVFKNVPDVSTPTISTDGVVWSTPSGSDNYALVSSSSPVSISAGATADADATVISSTTMMVIPQTLSWDNTEFSSSSDPYVEVIYYATLSGAQSVGYSSVENYPDYESAKAGSGGTTVYTGPLYVKVAFPIPTNTTLVANTPYYITLGLGATSTSGGTSMSSDYVDADGNPVTITLKDNTEVTDPLPDEGEDLTPDATTTYVTVTASVLGWDEFGTISAN